MSVRPPVIRKSAAPVLVRKTDANVSLPNNAGVFTDCDGGGSAASRPMDVVIPNCKVGDWVSIQPRALVAAGSAGLILDAFTVVAGAAVHAVSGGGAFGLGGWFVGAGLTAPVIGVVSYQVQTGDLENVANGIGSVRFRLKYVKGTGTAGTINASGGWAWDMEGRGPFG